MLSFRPKSAYLLPDPDEDYLTRFSFSRLFQSQGLNGSYTYTLRKTTINCRWLLFGILAHRIGWRINERGRNNPREVHFAIGIPKEQESKSNYGIDSNAHVQEPWTKARTICICRGTQVDQGYNFTHKMVVTNPFLPPILLPLSFLPSPFMQHNAISK